MKQVLAMAMGLLLLAGCGETASTGSNSAASAPTPSAAVSGTAAVTLTANIGCGPADGVEIGGGLDGLPDAQRANTEVVIVQDGAEVAHTDEFRFGYFRITRGSWDKNKPMRAELRHAGKVLATAPVESRFPAQGRICG